MPAPTREGFVWALVSGGPVVPRGAIKYVSSLVTPELVHLARAHSPLSTISIEYEPHWNSLEKVYETRETRDSPESTPVWLLIKSSSQQQCTGSTHRTTGYALVFLQRKREGKGVGEKAETRQNQSPCGASPNGASVVKRLDA